MKTTIALFSMFALTLPALGADDKAARKAARAGIDMEALFTKIDANKDGALNKDEFGKLADVVREKGDKAVKIADRIKASANDLFTKLDADKNGALSLAEAKKFDITMLGGGAKKVVKDLDATFKKLDKNNDSKLSKDEFAKVADELAAANPDKAAKVAEKLKARVNDMFAMLDANKDDSLNLDEFKKFTGAKGDKKKVK